VTISAIVSPILANLQDLPSLLKDVMPFYKMVTISSERLETHWKHHLYQ
jgi:hypothetical protein